MLLIKQLGSHELGIRRSIPGKAGPYFLICKSWYHWFPPLSAMQENDCAPIRVSLEDYGEVVLPYVWHNSKRVHNQPNGRDEIRLYISGLKAIGANPQPNDLAVFKPLGASSGQAEHFRLQILKEGSLEHRKLSSSRHTSTNYWQTSEAADTAARPTANPLTFEGHTSVQAESPQVALDGKTTVDSNLLKFLARTPDEVVSSRTSDPTFRAIVLSAYENKCAISGEVIFAGKHINLEAAHIRPQAHDGLNLPSNGIALCRDLHWAFDKGAFTLDETGRISVHPEARCGLLATIHGKRPFVPSDAFYAPRQSFAQYHRERVYGLFTRSGTLAMPSDL